MDIVNEISKLPEFKTNEQWTNYKNELTFINLITRFYNICTNLFKWKNLPETCDVDYLEYSLWMFGKAIFVKDKESGYLTLRALPSGERNLYLKVLDWTAYGFGGYNKRYHLDNGLVGEDAVLIRNNRTMFPTSSIVLEYIYDISDIKRAINVNVEASKTPTIAFGDKDTMKSLRNMYKQKKNNEAFIMVDSDLANKLQVVDGKKEFLADKLLILKHDMLSELLSFLGIKYIVTEKKERLLTDEANASDMFSIISIDTMYAFRKQACELINKQFGLNVDVEINYDIVDMIRELEPQEQQDDKKEESANE